MLRKREKYPVKKTPSQKEDVVKRVENLIINYVDFGVHSSFRSRR